MKVYGREKARISSNAQADKLVRMGQRETTRTLEKFSANILLKESLYSYKEFELGDALSIGLMSSRDGAHCFIHRTFMEFFFARWMLREASNVVVSDLWVKKLPHDDQFARVRGFLDDILSLLTRGVLTLEEEVDVMSLERTMIVPSYQEDEVLDSSIYALILYGNAHILSFYAESFGEVVARALIKEVECNKWQLPFESKLAEALKPYEHLSWSRKGFSNGFSFTSHCLEWNNKYLPYYYTQSPATTSKHSEFLETILSLVEKFHLVNDIRTLISKKGFHWLFPNYSHSSFGSVTYNARLIRFLTGHKDTFWDVLMGLLFEREWMNFFKEMSVNNFDILTSVVDAVLSKSECLELLLAEEDEEGNEGNFFHIWLDTVRIRGLEAMKKVWDFIEARLPEREHRSRYIRQRDWDGLNVLAHSAYYEDPEVIYYIWDLASLLMSEEERKLWLMESFGSGIQFSPVEYLNWGFHKFLSDLARNGYLTGEELLQLLLSRDCNGQYFVLRDYPFCLFTAVLPLDHHLPGNDIRGILAKMESFYYGELWFFLKSSSPLNDDLRDTVELIFQEVRARDRYNLTDPIGDVDKNGHMLGFYGKYERRIRADRFKYFVAIIHKHIELELENLGTGEVLYRLRMPSTLPPQYGPNMLFHIIYYKNPLPLGYIFSILTNALPPEDVKALLFECDDDGNTLFHEATDEMFGDVWGKLYDVARVLLGEEALCKVHSRANRKGQCVQDLFQCLEEEVDDVSDGSVEHKKRCILF